MLPPLFAAQPAAPAAGMDPQRLAQIPVRMKEFVDKGQLSGAVTLVARRGVIVAHDAVGWQDVEEKTPMRKDSIFQIMSMTKPVTGVAIMILAEEGRLRLVDPVEKHLPEFRGLMLEIKDASGKIERKKPSRLITIADLMTHTSGMQTSPTGEWKDLYQKMDRTLAQAVAAYAKLPLDFEPGTKWQYSNMGIAALGRIVEVVSGQPFEKFIEQRIFTPLGMKDSFIFPPPAKVNRIALVYRSKNGKLERAGPDILGGPSWAFRKGAVYSAPEFGLYSTAEDLFRFYQMMLNGGRFQGRRVLSQASVDVMTATHTGDLKTGHIPGAGRGLTWETVRTSEGTLLYLSEGTFGHGGAFGTHGYIDRKRSLVGVFLVQSAGGGAAADAKYAFMQMAASAVLD
jgi:CubicO group peptidase (beta-lactamase class C family)